MKYALLAVLLTGLALGQGTDPAVPNDSNSGATPPASQAIPTDQANAQKAKQIIDQAIEALGGQAYLNITDMKSEGRAYSFHHGEPNSMGTVFWRFRKFPDKDRVELTKKRDVIQIYNGDKGYEITFKGVRDLPLKDQLEPYLRRRHYSLDIVLRQWLQQPGVALFYEGQKVAAQKQTEQVTIMNSKNEAVTLNVDMSMMARSWPFAPSWPSAEIAAILPSGLTARLWVRVMPEGPRSRRALMAPVLLALSHLFTMNAFDPLLWTAIAFLIVRIVRSCDEHLWLAVGALAGVTILNKYAFLFWLSGVVLGVCLTPLRRSLRHRWFWFGCANMNSTPRLIGSPVTRLRAMTLA